MGGVVIAFSGGVDSSLLLAAARDVLGERVLAVTGCSPTYPARELVEARKIAALLGVRHVTIETNELDDSAFRANPPRRCYFCKRGLFTALMRLAREEGLPFVLDGTNADDLRDFRPGSEAARELGVRSPFIELGMGKERIRRLARARGLSNWGKPSSACLASRIPYGEEITGERLRRIQDAEELLRSLGFHQVRVRDHGVLARIEVARDELDRMIGAGVRVEVTAGLKKLGYTYVCLDLQGYRTGAMNESVVTPQSRRDFPQAAAVQDSRRQADGRR